jgi:two-component system, NtrC family, response regulator AlgB
MDLPESVIPLTVLLVDDEPNIRKVLGISLEAEGHHVTAVGNVKDALHEARRRSFDLALVDLRLGTESGMELITALRALCSWTRIVVITAYASIDTAVEAMRRGAFDYLPKPFTHEQVAMLTRKVAEVRALEQKVATLQETLSEIYPEVDLTTHSPAMQRTLELARQVADSDATILISGESGTGKTVLARAIHSWSSRAAKPFCIISCPSLSAELLESELFGHVKGAFTGAVRDYPGRIAACRGGTLLLDEISDLPLSIQPKFLRVLQEKSYERVGDLETRRADVRILAATNVDIEAAVKAKTFREDLFYRLNVVDIVVPPLRERREDILPLAERMIAFFARQSHRRVLGLTEQALQVLLAYDWPGNVRELHNAIERAVLLCNDEHIGVEHLPVKLAPTTEPMPNIGDLVSLEKIEEMHIRRVLTAARSFEEAAEILGMDSVTLWRRRKKYGI